MFLDFFKYSDYEEANIAELKRVMIFTAMTETKIEVRHYEMKSINETDVKKQSLGMSEIGPCFDLSFRRDKIAAADLYKAACKQPRLESVDNKRMNKNVYTDEFGQTKGKVFIQQQDIDTLVTRKYNKIKGNKLNKNNVPKKGKEAEGVTTEV